MKKVILLFFIALNFFFLNAQKTQEANSIGRVGLVSYSSGIVGANYNLTNNFSTELKTYLNRDIEDISLEFDFMFRFSRKEFHQVSLGGGLKIDPLTDGGEGTAVAIPVQLNIYPLRDVSRLCAIIELAPEYYFEDVVRLRSLVGIGYSFGK